MTTDSTLRLALAATVPAGATIAYRGGWRTVVDTRPVATNRGPRTRMLLTDGVAEFSGMFANTARVEILEG